MEVSLTHPLVVSLWSAAIVTAAVFALFTGFNAVSYSERRDSESLVYLTFTATGVVYALCIASAFIPMSDGAKACVFRFVWVFGTTAIWSWMRAVRTFVGVESPALVALGRGMLVVGALYLLDVITVVATGYSFLYLPTPRGTKSIALMAAGDVFTLRPLAMGLSAVTLVLLAIAVVLLLRLTARYAPSHKVLRLGIGVTAVAASIEVVFSSTDHWCNVPLLFAANLIEGARISWAHRARILTELRDTEREQRDQAARLSAQADHIAWSQRMAQLGEDSSRVGLDLQSSVKGVRERLGSLERRRTESLGETEAADVLRVVREGLGHVLRLAELLTRQSRMHQASRPCAVSVAESYAEATELCGSLVAGLEVSSSIPADLTVQARPAELTQVFVNLLNNAARRSAKAEGAWVRVEGYQQRESVVIQVADSSGRPSPEVARQLFRNRVEEQQEAGGGKVDGMLICAQLVHRNQGRIHLDPRSLNTSILVELPAPRRASATG